jgi:ribonuclease BN (tRNA processing enzyme)
MRLTVIGSGDAFGSGGRFNTCFMLEAAGRVVLIDFGASSLVALKARGIDLNTIDGVVLSHLHGDHFGALPFFLLDSQYLARRDRPFLIAGPPGTRERVNAALEVFFPNSSGTAWRFPWSVVEITPGETADVLGLDVTTSEVVHPSGAPSTGVRVSDGSRTFAYSGDTEWTEALIGLAADADLFIVECYEYERALKAHMTWNILKSKLPQLRARRIMLTHMNPSMLARIDEAQAAGVLTASDGLVVDL